MVDSCCSNVSAVFKEMLLTTTTTTNLLLLAKICITIIRRLLIINRKFFRTQFTGAQRLRNRKIFKLAPYHSYSETGLKASLWEYSCYFAQYDYWSPHFL